MPKPKKKSPSHKPAGAPVGPAQLRLIGGLWRGRKLQFPPLPGLRPSPDRVRETLFNWLQLEVAGSRCLDLFAGSGALGLEALSRGAVHCTLVDSHPEAIRSIGEHLRLLQCSAGTTVCRNVLEWLRTPPPAAFDIVFLDPPFREAMIGPCCELLEANGWLARRAVIYIESAADEPLPALPANWSPHRDKRAGQVAYRLLRREADASLSGSESIG